MCECECECECECVSACVDPSYLLSSRTTLFSLLALLFSCAGRKWRHSNEVPSYVTDQEGTGLKHQSKKGKEKKVHRPTPRDGTESKPFNCFLLSERVQTQYSKRFGQCWCCTMVEAKMQLCCCCCCCYCCCCCCCCCCETLFCTQTGQRRFQSLNGLSNVVPLLMGRYTENRQADGQTQRE